MFGQLWATPLLLLTQFESTCTVSIMIIVGLTGGIATGKTTVTALLSTIEGFSVVDADSIARQIVEKGQPAYHKICREFGNKILTNSNKEIDRKALGDLIFSNELARKKLNKITHPYIQRKMLFKIIFAFFKGDKCVIIDSPLLFESGKFLKYLHATIVVYCDQVTQKERLILRNKLSPVDASNRINSQMDLKEKCKLSDLVINNSQDRCMLTSQITLIQSELINLSKKQGISRKQFTGVSLIIFFIVSITVYLIFKLFIY